jgi:hypothetical protein
MMVVLLSVARKATLDEGIDTAKSVAFKLFKSFSVSPEPFVVLLLDVVVPVEVDEVVTFGLWKLIDGFEVPPWNGY